MSNKTEDFKRTIGKLPDIIDHAVSTGDFHHMTQEIGNVVKDAASYGSDVIFDAASQGAESLKNSGRSKVIDASWTDVDENGNPIQRWDDQPGYEQKAAESPSYNQGQDFKGRGQLGYRDLQKQASSVVSDVMSEWRRRADLERQKESQLAPYFMPPASSMGNRIGSIVGGAGGILWGFGTLICFISVLGGSGRYGLIGGAIAGAFTGLHVLFSKWNGNRASLLDRFNKYRKMIGEHLYTDVQEIADKTYRTADQVRTDLKELMKLGLIRQGHFDKNETCFIASDELYHQYLLSEQGAAAREAEIRQAEEKRLSYSPEVQRLLAEGNDYIEAIRRANDAIPGEVMSGKLNRTEALIRRIFDEVKLRPELAGRLNTFMDYYLPTTRKLVDIYADLDQKKVKGENVEAARSEIEDSLDLINQAFENLLDSFFKEQVLDVASDISVMKTMLKQDGLTEDDLSRHRRETEEANPFEVKADQEAAFSENTKTTNPFEKYEH